MSTTIPALSSVTDILDSDLVMITHSSGESFKISGAEINKRNQAVIASSTTVTGAPLKTGNIVRVYFTVDITGSNTTTALTLNYNSVNYSVKVPKNGTLVNFVASDLGGSPTVYKYLQAYTTLELLYDGTQFIIIGNPVVLSSSDYTIYADGLKIQTKIIEENRYTVPKNGGSINVTVKTSRTAIIYSALYNGIYILAFALGQYSTTPIISTIAYNGITCEQGSNTNEIKLKTGDWVAYDIPIIIKYI